MKLLTSCTKSIERKEKIITDNFSEFSSLHRYKTWHLIFASNCSNLNIDNCLGFSTLLGEWATDGCWIIEFDRQSTTCQCEHLTNFAVLMDVQGTKVLN